MSLLRTAISSRFKFKLPDSSMIKNYSSHACNSMTSCEHPLQKHEVPPCPPVPQPENHKLQLESVGRAHGRLLLNAKYLDTCGCEP